MLLMVGKLTVHYMPCALLAWLTITPFLTLIHCLLAFNKTMYILTQHILRCLIPIIGTNIDKPVTKTISLVQFTFPSFSKTACSEEHRY